MRVVEIDRQLAGRGLLSLPNGESVDPAWVTSVFDRLRLPDGFPFVVDDLGVNIDQVVATRTSPYQRARIAGILGAEQL